MISNFKKIKNQIKIEGLDVCLISYGGCGTNTLADALEKNNYKCRTEIWEWLSHCSKTFDAEIPIVYLYRNPIHAFLSMRRRRLISRLNFRTASPFRANQKKLKIYAAGKPIKTWQETSELSYEILLNLMINQFNVWTSSNLKNLLIINYDELFNNSIKDKLCKHLNNNDLNGFPIPYKKPQTNSNFTLEINDLFTKYAKEINFINSFNLE